MFYLQTKDGESFFTSSTSNDKVEFTKIVDSKMGSDAAEMLDHLLKDAYEEGEEAAAASDLTPLPWEELDKQSGSLRSVTSKLWISLAAIQANIDKEQTAQIESYLQKLDSIAYHLENI